MSSAYQLEHLIGKQSCDAEHEMKPDFLSATNHYVSGSELFFSRLLNRSATLRSR